MIVVLVGLSGTGKSFVASILHKEFGFEWIRSDQIRKEMAGMELNEKVRVGFSQGIYSEEWTRRVYERMLELAEIMLKQGKKVVLDATFLRKWQRDMVLKRFPDAIFIWITADEEEILKRLKTRVDISDADVDIYLKQKEVFEPPEHAIMLDTTKNNVKERLREILEGSDS
ncbi:AAA family ATPase [Thermocrinis sp.]